MCVVTDSWKEDLENPAEHVQVHGIASHVLHLRVVGGPFPQFGVNALSAHGFMRPHSSAALNEPQAILA